MIGIVGAFVIGIIGYGFYTGLRINKLYAPLIDAAMEIKLEATTAHLWFEEIVAGDRIESMQEVWDKLSLAEWYANAMLKGGESPEGIFLPLDDKELRIKIQRVLDKLLEFRKITDQRLTQLENSGPGSELDQVYDSVFRTFLHEADEVESRLQFVMARDLKNFRFIQITMIILCTLIFFIIEIAFHRFERQRASDFSVITETNEKLQKEVLVRQRIEEQHESLIEELEVKNAELERFTYTVSHDLKSPLITIRGFLGMMEKDMEAGLTERTKTDMERISSAALKMQVLLEELLELSRIGRLVNPPEEVPFEEVIRDAMETVAGRLAEMNVRIDISPELPIICVDRRRIQEVVENLLDNAVKFMGDQPDPRIEIGAIPGNNGKELYIRDNGVGIESRYHEKIFSLFDKLDQQAEGTGVGLAIVRRIIEVHGGRIWAKSEGRGKGATFYFTLPEIKKSDNKE